MTRESLTVLRPSARRTAVRLTPAAASLEAEELEDVGVLDVLLRGHGVHGPGRATLAQKGCPPLPKHSTQAAQLRTESKDS